jgi:hypothetical protein
LARFGARQRRYTTVGSKDYRGTECAAAWAPKRVAFGSPIYCILAHL